MLMILRSYVFRTVPSFCETLDTQRICVKNRYGWGVVRRKSSDVARIVGRERFLDEIERRGFRALENSGQIIVICNTDPIRMLR